MYVFSFLRYTIFVMGLLALMTGWVKAQTDAEAPAVLKIVQSSQEPFMLSMAALQALDQESFETSTIWTDGVHEFRGVCLKELLKHLNVTADEVIATAINDYAVRLPVPAEDEDGPILALEMDGAPMSRRGKGPVWLMYPYDSHAKFRTQTIYARSVWQLNTIEIVH